MTSIHSKRVARCRAQLYDDQGKPLVFDHALRIHVAEKPGEVLPVIDGAEKDALAGHHVIGFVCYEAATELDPALVTKAPGELPLAWFAVFSDPVESATSNSYRQPLHLSPEIDEAAYRDAIAGIKDRLEAGDTYQVNFTHQMTGGAPENARATFDALISAQPSNYAAFIETDEFSICSVSPELFFERKGIRISMAPMKGTRARGRTSSEDQARRQDLHCSIKDRAENLMIVDMIRNDLGRIARAGTVKAERLFEIIKLPTVWQMVSHVTAESDATLPALFSALFPCASVTGAPKAKTMEIITELETSARGVYTGTVGWIRPGGDARFNVGIRTLVIENKFDRASYGVGGGIVWDSDPVAEWQECSAKAEVLTRGRPNFELLETMKYEPGNGIYLLERHLERLAESARYFDYPFDAADINAALQSIESDAPLRLRLLLSANGSIEVQRYPLDLNDEVVRLGVAEQAIDSGNPFLYHKTTHREAYEAAINAAADIDDVVLFNERGELTETTIYNLFIEKDGVLSTPPVSSGLLAGTLRSQLIAEGRVRESLLYMEDLLNADGIQVGNGVRGLRTARLVKK